MPDTKISNLSAASTLTGVETFAAVQSAATVKVTIDNIKTYLDSVDIFSQARATASPNNTVYADSLTAVGSTTDVDFVSAPKGAGANLAQIPDSAAAGGNKRGTYATDFQKYRTSATHVANGNYAFIGAGYSNIASGARSGVISGNNNTASGTASIAAGDTCVASATCTVSMGQLNTVSATHSTSFGYGNAVNAAYSVAIGYSNTASGVYSWVPGGSNATTRGLNGAYAYANGQVSTVGDRQVIGQVVRRDTAATTTVSLSADGSAPSATTIMAMPNTSMVQFTATVGALSGSDAGSWTITGTMYRGANAAATALIGTTTIINGGISAALATCVVDVVADTTNGGPVIQVTPIATATKWAGKIECVQIDI